jgi:cytochrome c biogenesis protein CcmG, thiol:disulfide interchange protein DsbE
VVGVVLAGALGVVLFSSLGSSGNSTPTVGSAAPTFSLSALGGRSTVGIPADGGGDGRPAVLVFFASWCPPCRVEIPAVARVYRDQPARSRVAIIGVDGMDAPAAALGFVRSSGVTFPVAVDARYSVTEALYALTGEPDAVFVAGDGTIARIVHGPITAEQLVAWERALG